MSDASSRSSTRTGFLMAAGAAAGFGLVRAIRWRRAGAWAARKASGGARTLSAHGSFAVNCTAEEAYRRWRDFENVTKFLRHVDSVRVLDEKRTEWTIAGPLGQRFRWVAEIVEDLPGKRIAWRSVEGSDVHTHGTIEFQPRTSGRGIVVTARVDYAPPAGVAIKGLLTALGRDPEFTLREDLRRFKALLEAGEVPTVAGQPHGPRGLTGAAYRQVLREAQNATTPQAGTQAA